MADINAVDLTAETLASLDGTENVVGFDTAEGKKIPISVLADYAIQKKTQTIAGATQTPKVAMDSAYSLAIGAAIPSNSDADTYTTPGSYYVSSNSVASSVSNLPVAKAGRLNVETEGSASVIRQSFKPYDKLEEYTRRLSGATVGTWEKLPTRAEMDAVSTRASTLRIANISASSTGKIDTDYINPSITSSGGTATTYGAYFIVLRTDTASDGASCYIVRHNSVGYQISTIYEGTATATPVVTSDGVLKMSSSTSNSTVHAFYVRLASWS